MAKKKVKKAKKVKKVNVKKTIAVKIEAPVKVQEKPVKKKNPLLIPLITIAVLLLVAGEIYFVVQREMKLNKKPVFVGQWRGEYRGQVGIPVYGDHLFVIDNDLNQIKKYEKLKGKLIDVFEVEETPMWAVGTSKGDTYVLLVGSNLLKKFTKGSKYKGKVVLKGGGTMAGMTIDSKDNIYVAEHGTNKILKYSQMI